MDPRRRRCGFSRRRPRRAALGLSFMEAKARLFGHPVHQMLIVVGLFAGSWFLRRPNSAEPVLLAIILSAIGVGIAMITGWLGGELVGRLGVGVAEGAHVDAPSSLSSRPASETTPH